MKKKNAWVDRSANIYKYVQAQGLHSSGASLQAMRHGGLLVTEHAAIPHFGNRKLGEDKEQFNEQSDALRRALRSRCRSCVHAYLGKCCERAVEYRRGGSQDETESSRHS